MNRISHSESSDDSDPELSPGCGGELSDRQVYAIFRDSLFCFEEAKKVGINRVQMLEIFCRCDLIPNYSAVIYRMSQRARRAPGTDFHMQAQVFTEKVSCQGLFLKEK